MKPVYEWFKELKEYHNWSHISPDNYEGYQKVYIKDELKCQNAVDWLHANEAFVPQADWVIIDNLFFFTTEEHAILFKLSVDL